MQAHGIPEMTAGGIVKMVDTPPPCPSPRSFLPPDRSDISPSGNFHGAHLLLLHEKGMPGHTVHTLPGESIPMASVHLLNPVPTVPLGRKYEETV